MRNPRLGVSLQNSDDGLCVVFTHPDGETAYWFDDEDAIRQLAEISAYGLALLADASVLGFAATTELHGLTVKDEPESE